jgi:hypothetical protein
MPRYAYRVPHSPLSSKPASCSGTSLIWGVDNRYCPVIFSLPVVAAAATCTAIKIGKDKDKGDDAEAWTTPGTILLSDESHCCCMSQPGIAGE